MDRPWSFDPGRRWTEAEHDPAPADPPVGRIGDRPASLPSSQALDPRALDLGRLVRGTVERFRSRAVEAGVDLSVVVLQAPGVLGDQPALIQIIDTLLSHGAGLTFGGGHVRVTVNVRAGVAEVWVRTSRRRSSQGRLTAATQGTEDARPPGLLETLYPGAGLGLLTARRLAEDHAGTLTAENAGGPDGPVFLLRLPILPPATDPDHNARG